MVLKSRSFAIGIIFWMIFHFIILPYEAYWLFNFYKNRNALIIKKRKPMLVAIATFCLWIYMLLQFTHSIVTFEFMTWEQNIPLSAPEIIRNMLYQPFIWTFLIIHSGRYWLMFYMINYNSSAVNNKWQSVIDPKQSLSNWYIQNKTKWGSFKYIRKWIIAYGVAVYVVVKFFYTLSLIHYDNDNDYSISYTLSNISLTFLILFVGPVPIIFYVYILCKIPAFTDNIGIRKELQFSICFLVVLIAVVIIFNIIISIMHKSGDMERYVVAIFLYVYLFILRVLFTISITTSTRWPLVTFKEIVLGKHSSSRMIELVHQKTYASIDEHALIMKQEKQVIALRNEMKNTLQNSRLFDAFMKHLLNEYCAECLLSIIEFTQFKQKIADENKDIDFTETNGLIHTIFKLPDDLVKSIIVYGDNDTNNISNYSYMAHQLYNKYIRIGSEWEINIDYHNRNRYREIFEYQQFNENKKELYQLFDPCIDHMIALIMSSFTRFRNGKQYKLIQQYSPPTPPQHKIKILKLIPAISASDNIVEIINVDKSVLTRNVDQD